MRQHLAGGAGGILAHAVGYQIFHRDNRKGRTIFKILDKGDMVARDSAVERHVANDFETEAEIGMNPPACSTAWS
ncbi:hypothetical protein SFOMI_1399 [Sphingobium fuliginis]|uniref:Uncharacterized protein n=1 Tax=Sphingobium fuliginis (strain ATCC 27551) TaxID=336203 RepID=A0A292ZDE7_SPHSA|nr:hypothetical protein SFOMI_1399 [Sphingobium fuliginis]